MKYLYGVYQWLIAVPVLIPITILTAIITSIGCSVGSIAFWSYYPGMLWSRLVCFILLIPVEVRGKENLNTKQSTVFVSNHQGSFDIFLIYGYLGQPFKWMMKQSLRKIPFVGAACAAAGHIYVDPAGNKGTRQTLAQAKATLQKGMSLVVFPEGSRTLTGKMGRFRKGAYMLAMEFSLPVTPLTIDGSFQILPRSSCMVRPHKLILTIHPPIYPDAITGHDLNKLIMMSSATIASALPLENKD